MILALTGVRSIIIFKREQPLGSVESGNALAAVFRKGAVVETGRAFSESIVDRELLTRRYADPMDDTA